MEVIIGTTTFLCASASVLVTGISRGDLYVAKGRHLLTADHIGGKEIYRVGWVVPKDNGAYPYDETECFRVIGVK